ncbi:MAG: hypothetical protein HY909_23110 [Deltaproteobacteria bacterium]|nr:hypothetical protein [Deltaproteobacteria bacterium]
MHTLARVLLALAAFLCAPAAQAWTDARPSGLVTELAVDRDGGATVTVRVRWRVLAGRMHQFDLVELPPDLVLLEATATGASGVALPISARALANNRLEVHLGDEASGVRRGTVDVVLRYTTSLRAQGLIRRAGPDTVLEFSTSPWERGLEATELRIALPTSARRAQWLADDTPGVDATTTTELSRDVVHALRRHLPAGARWTARVAVDPSLFPWLGATVAQRHRTQRVTRADPRLVAGTALALALFTALTLRRLGRRDGPRLVPLPRGQDHAVAALCAAGATLQALWLREVPFTLPVGTFLLLVAVALTAPRPRPLRLAAAEGPFRAAARKALRGTLSERGERAWGAFWALLGLGLAAGALGLRRGLLPAGLLSLDAALLGLGLLALRHPTGAPSDLAALDPLARRIHQALRGFEPAALAWRCRGDALATGALRLRLQPRAGWALAPGVQAPEWGVAMHPGTLGWRPSTVAILRFTPGAPVEGVVRALSLRAGTLRHSPDGALLAYTVELLGPDRQAFLGALRAVASRCFVRAREEPAP